MGRRHYKRLRIELPVTVSGLDTDGNPFTQSATTVEISAGGLLLRGISCLRGRGDPVQVRYKRRSARYRLAWIGEPASSSQGLVGLEGMKDAALLFADHLSPDFLVRSHPQVDSYVVPSKSETTTTPAVVRLRKPDRQPGETRRHPRFNCAGMARMWQDGNEHVINGRINEISMGGCYIEIMSPLLTGTSVRLELEVNSRTVHVHGVVRASQPMYGMGIEFTKIAPTEAEKLHRIIDEVSGAAPAEAQPPPVPQPPANVSGNELADAVLRWFGSHDALTRQEFLKLMEEATRAGQDLPHG